MRRASKDMQLKNDRYFTDYVLGSRLPPLNIIPVLLILSVCAAKVRQRMKKKEKGKDGSLGVEATDTRRGEVAKASKRFWNLAPKF